MRRFVALLLLCLFSLQAGWAVAARYCQHESASAAAHFGHHTHAHAADDTKADPGAGTPGTLAPDLDCHGCHANPAGVGCAPLAFMAAAAAMPPPQRLAEALPAPPRARVERPNWQRPA